MTVFTDDIRRYFEGANFGHVATVLPDGAPHSVPVWVDVEGDRIAFLTGPATQKARNLEQDPRVAISITEYARPHSMATIRGRVTHRLEGDEAWAIIDRISEKYIGAPYPERRNRVVFIVEVEWASTVKFD
jgi:PPOX class probable F420-dependent enzyme